MMNDSSDLSRDDILRRYQQKVSEEPAPSERRSPFKFLDSYDVNDSDLFFGRDPEIAELLQLYHQHGHVLIYGESGTGKTSLVQCGVRSRIPIEDALFITLRFHSTGLSALNREICDEVSQQLGEPIECSEDWGLIDTLREVRDIASRPIVMFFDQFEELFIFYDAEARQKFAETIASIPNSKLNVKVMIGVRQDYLATLERTGGDC